MSSADQVLLATLSEGASFCRRCRVLNLDFARAVGDFNRVAHLAAHDARDKDWTTHLERAEHDRSLVRGWAENHLTEPHEPPEPSVATTSTPVAAEPDTRIVCPDCGQRVNQRADGRINRHTAKSGNPCRRRLVSVSVEAPPISIPVTPGGPGRNVLPVTGACHTCGKRLPGERRFCGQCLRKRGRM